jgi:hypothetical protein
MQAHQQVATNPAKRETFARLAEGHDRQADDLESLIASGKLQDVQWQEPEIIAAEG